MVFFLNLQFNSKITISFFGEDCYCHAMITSRVDLTQDNLKIALQSDYAKVTKELKPFRKE